MLNYVSICELCIKFGIETNGTFTFDEIRYKKKKITNKYEIIVNRVHLYWLYLHLYLI